MEAFNCEKDSQSIQGVVRVDTGRDGRKAFWETLAESVQDQTNNLHP